MLRSAATLPASGSAYYHHHDALGNVVALTNAASYAVLETYTYDAFGKRTVYNTTGQQLPDTAYANTHGYTGREHLPLHGLMDYRNRSYSTTLGRFLQPDPIRFDAGDLNIYRYVGNNVMNLTDPLGLMGARPRPNQPVNNGPGVNDVADYTKAGGCVYWGMRCTQAYRDYINCVAEKGAECCEKENQIRMLTCEITTKVCQALR